jgi:hypothetical protein
VNGDTKPGYKVLFDGTAPEAIGTAAAGTGVVAAHRNHVHALDIFTAQFWMHRG